MQWSEYRLNEIQQFKSITDYNYKKFIFIHSTLL